MPRNAFSLRLQDDRVVTFVEPVMMGVINVSPESFYRSCGTLDEVLRTAEKMIAEGAAIIDVGGEATNPFVDIASGDALSDAECERVVPAVEAIKTHFDVLVSVDTSRARVMSETVAVGADMINDQRALRFDGALAAVVDLRVPVCLMHFFNPPREPGSSDKCTLLSRIKQELRETVNRCLEAGIDKARIVIDPGFGQGHYGKNTVENFYLLQHLRELTALGFPLLSGWSRKSMLGAILNKTAPDRLFGSIAADTLAVYQGASIIRTHDVSASRDAMRVAMSALEAEECVVNEG